MPPNIDDSQSSSDAIIREGANVSLTCKATGSPTPSIRWKRDDGSKISINKSLSGKNPLNYKDVNYIFKMCPIYSFKIIENHYKITNYSRSFLSASPC